jgi:hypothetical protein
MAFEDMSLMNRAANIGMYELLGDAELINLELGLYKAVTAKDIVREANDIFTASNSNTLYYKATKPAEEKNLEQITATTA